MEKVLIFDYDGVIVDSLEIFMKNFFMACEKNDANLINSKQYFLKLFDNNMYESMVNAGVPRESIAGIVKDLQAGLLKDQNKLQLFKGVYDMLESLSKKNKVIIITSNATRVVEEFLKSKNINYFEEVIGADKETSKVKKIETIKKRLTGCEYFYIGDTRGDIIEGRKAGAKTIAVTWGWHNEALLREKKPDFIVNTPAQLAKLFS